MNDKPVLIIDDDVLMARVLANYLADCGYRTLTACDGAYGLSLARSESCAAALVDLHMPGVDGLEIITCLHAEQPDLPLVVVSGIGVLGDAVEAMRRGAWDYVAKPIHDIKEVALVLERVLEKARLMAERDRYHHELEALNRSLEAQVAHQTEALQARNCELEALNAELKRAHAGQSQALAEALQASQALRQTHDQLEATLNALPDLLFEVDRAGRIYAFRAPRPDLLYAPPQDFLGKTVGQVLPEEAAHVIMDAIAQAVETGRHIGNTYSLLTPAGASYFELSIAVMGDPQAPRERLIVLVRDVTERQQAEDALRRSEERFRQVVLSISDPIYVTEITPDGVFVNRYLSPHLATLTGYPLEKFQADWHFWSLVVIHPADRAQAIAHFACLTAGQGGELEYRLVRADGQVVWVRDSIRLQPQEDGLRLVYGVISDITAHKQSEQALRKSQADLAKAQQIAHLGSYYWNAQTGQTWWSDEMRAILGCPTQPASYQLAESLIHPEDRPRFYDVGRYTREQKADTLKEEYRIVRPDGSVRYILDQAEITRDEIGQAVDVFGVLLDITERKQIEEKLKALLAEKDVLLAEVHHRVKNNMQVIISLLRLQAARIHDEWLQQAFKESQGRIRSMALVHERLYRSHNFAQVDFAGYVRDLVMGLFQVYHVGDYTVALKIEVEDIWLSLDTAIPCGLILNELVTNCLKHAFPMPAPGLRPGEGEPADQPPAYEVRVGLHSQDGCLELSVSDNGRGFPPDVDFRHTSSLGLQLVSTLATHDLRGAIELSREGGATFKITFVPGQAE